MTPTDRAALEQAIEIAREDRAQAARLDERLAAGDDWYDIAVSACFHCQMEALHLKPWQIPPCFAHITEPRRDENAIKLLHRLLAAGLSRYEPLPMEALARVEAKRAVATAR